MAGEFEKLLKGFGQLSTNYCENAKKVVPGPDYAKLVGIYQEGLTGAVAGMTKLLGEHYGKADREQRRQMDEYVSASGALPMLVAANKAIGKNSMADPGALHASGNIFEKLKAIMSDIPGIVQIVVPFIGAVPKILSLIDLFVENIRRLFGPSESSAPGGPTVAAPPPPVPSIVLQPCQWQTLYEGNDAKEFNAFSGDGAGQVEVRIDGKLQSGRLEGFYKKLKGKKIEVHLVPGGTPTAEVGYRPV